METGRISEGPGGSPGLVSSGSDKGENPVDSSWESYSASGASKPPLSAQGKLFFPSFFQRLRPQCHGSLATAKAMTGTGSASELLHLQKYLCGTVTDQT